VLHLLVTEVGYRLVESTRRLLVELLIRAHTNVGPPVDLVVMVEASHRVADLAAALADYLQLSDRQPVLTTARGGRALDAGEFVSSTDLLSGDDVLVGVRAASGPVPPIPIRAVTVDVVAGPETGMSIILPQGTFRIGRDPAMDIVVDDPTVSRHHLDVTVGPDWGTVVSPLPDVENRVSVNGVVIEGVTAVSGDDRVSLGSTVVALSSFVRAPDDRVDQLGQIEFQRTPYRPPVIAVRSMDELGPVPSRPEPRRFQIVAAVSPLAAGLLMYAVSKQAQFLALTALSPIALIAGWFEDRRSGKARFAGEVEAFKRRIEQRQIATAAAVERERIERLRAAPEIADLARRAELRTVDLWSRGRLAPDALTVRVGIGRLPSQVKVPVERTTDEEFRSLLAPAVEIARVVEGVPITLDLMTNPVVAAYGEPAVVRGLAASLLMQVACLHSPEDIAIAAAVPSQNSLVTWMKWLPHTRSVTSPLAGDHLVTTAAAGDELLARIKEVIDFRMSFSAQERAERNWPRIVVLLDDSLGLDAIACSQLFDVAGGAGVSVLWLAEAEARLPRQASAIVQCRSDVSASRGVVWFTDPEIPQRDVLLEQVRPAIADRMARALAPVRDASAASRATSIPRTAPLLDVVGSDAILADSVAGRWTSELGYSLRFPVGIGAEGIFSLDLVEDGPHALIGGTSGAGKSELLQSIVTSLAVQYPSSRLNFLFVDYKGGASSDVFASLPHTVGAVTNLSAELSLRALTSLRAELNQRMKVLQQFEAKDLRDLLERQPTAAPPSLVIVVDEFATLVKEVPEFVAGIVDIAQRGRSLGIHLILATQRPSGSVNDNILANTNLRIALRMLDRSESVAVINSPEAADIPVPLRGRAFARLGPRSLTPFQSAYCSAPLTNDTSVVPVLVGPFGTTVVAPKARRVSVVDGTQLDAVLSAIVSADEQLGLPAPRRPWREVLPDVIGLDDVLADVRSAAASKSPGRLVAIGMVDDPDAQDQYPLLVDLELGSGCLVYGAGGSGKTTLLRTVAVSASRCAPHGEVAIVAFDFASRGLTSIAPLPHVVEVATGDDLESVTRLVSVLDGELARRRLLLGDANAEDLTAFNRSNAPLPRVLVLIDNLGALLSAFFGASGGMSSSISLESWAERLLQVVSDGRQVGIHVVATADRRSAVPARTQAAVSNRIILRQADESGYGDHGIGASRARGLSLEAGAGMWQAHLLMQIATCSSDASGAGQAEAIATTARGMRLEPLAELRSEPLRDRQPAADLEKAVGPWTVPIGCADITGATIMVDLARSHFLVVGPGGSGRSTALARCIHGLVDTQVWQVSLPTSPLAELATSQRAVGVPGAVQLVDDLAAAAATGAGQRHVLVVDDFDEFDDPSFVAAVERLLKFESVRVIASIDSRGLTGYTPNSALNEMRRVRRVLALQPADANEILQAFGVRPPFRPGMQMPAGRGVYLEGRLARVVQVGIDT
jgi:S-DNA-T family DNA segregation ATPase FtsK/SpoIIIE